MLLQLTDDLRECSFQRCDATRFEAARRPAVDGRAEKYFNIRVNVSKLGILLNTRVHTVAYLIIFARLFIKCGFLIPITIVRH